MTHSASEIAYDAGMLRGVCERQGIRLLVLFGSRATGMPSPRRESDADLAFSMMPGKVPDTWQIQAGLAEVFSDIQVDLASLAAADPLFRWEIMRDAVLLWGSPDDFHELRAFAYRDFMDSADLRALERILSEKKLERIKERIRAAR